VAKNCLGSAGGKKTGKKRKLEERTGGVLSATAATASSSSANNGGLAPPQESDWLKSLKEAHPKCRILQRLTIIFGDVADLQGVVS
jgi:hypothetical protein